MKFSLIIFCLLFSGHAYAGKPISSYSQDSLKKLYAELHYLHRTGLDIHQKYDEKIAEEPLQMRFCMGEYGFITTRAKATIGMANRLNSVNKEEYIATGWKALECVSCEGNVSSCDAIPPTLDTIEQEYKSSKSQ